MASPTVLAAFRCTFDDVHGPTLVASASSEAAVELKGIEWAALPSGLHAVEEDSFFFTWHGYLALCHFTSVSSHPSPGEGVPASPVAGTHPRIAGSAGAGRGRTMVTSGLLVLPTSTESSSKSNRRSPSRRHRQRPFHSPAVGVDFAHEMERGRVISLFAADLERASNDLASDHVNGSSKWEGWANRLFLAARLTAASEDSAAETGGANRSPLKAASLFSSPSTVGTDTNALRHRQNDRHPLAFLPLLPSELLAPLAKVLPDPQTRVLLLLSRGPPLERACSLAWALGAVSRLGPFSVQEPLDTNRSGVGGSQRQQGWRQEREDGLEVLGVVGLGSIDHLCERASKGHGWIAVTTDALFRERPELYDVLLVLDSSSCSPRTSSSAGTDDLTPFTGCLTIAIHPSAPPRSPSPTGMTDMASRPPRAKSITSALAPTWWDTSLTSALIVASGRSSDAPAALVPATQWLGTLWDGCGWCLELLFGGQAAGVLGSGGRHGGGGGAVYLPLATEDDGSGYSNDTDDEGSLNNDEADDVVEALWPARSTLEVISRSNSHLAFHLLALLPFDNIAPSDRATESLHSPERLLTSFDLVRLGLSPLGSLADRVRVRALSKGAIEVGERWF